MAKTYNPSEDREYQKYLEKLDQLRQDKPQYQSQYAQQVQGLYDQLQNRQEFAYDINSDALYRAMTEQYTRLGKLSMADTMAQAQAMTGGYGNSYAQTAGQQAYQSYLGKLTQLAPEYYDRALQRYLQQGSDLQQRYDLARQQEDQELSGHKSALDAYRRELEYLQGQADQAYDRGYRQYLDSYTRQAESYERLKNLIEKHRYKPTDQELEEAGMTRAQAEALLR